MNAQIPQEITRLLLRMMARWTHEWMRRTREYLRQRDLSLVQLMVLRQLQYRGPCSVSDIAQALGVTRAAASQLLDRLVAQGLVVREEDPKDRRHKRLVLSPKGRAFLDELTEAHRMWVHTLLARLTPEEQQTLARALVLLEAHLRRMAQSPAESSL